MGLLLKSALKSWQRNLVLLFVVCPLIANAVPVDLSNYNEKSGIRISQNGDLLTITWALTSGLAAQDSGSIAFNLQQGNSNPLIQSLNIKEVSGTTIDILDNLIPYTAILTTRKRTVPEALGDCEFPPLPQFDTTWDLTWDTPAYGDTYGATLSVENASVVSGKSSLTLILGEWTAGIFSGKLHFSVYDGSPLVFMESQVSTSNDHIAILYHAGLTGDNAGWSKIARYDPDYSFTSTDVSLTDRDDEHAVRYRMIGAQGSQSGAIAVFPPPHFFNSLYDFVASPGLKNSWYGRNHAALAGKSPIMSSEFGIGIRDDSTPAKTFANAPPGSIQRLGMFIVLDKDGVESAMEKARSYTHSDRFPDLAGYRKVTNHWHLNEQIDIDDDAKKVFTDMGLNIYITAAFHHRGHPNDTGEIRCRELDDLFNRLRDYSDEDFLVLPGEEVSRHLLTLPEGGCTGSGSAPKDGHWMALFPKPVYWTRFKENENTPFKQNLDPFGEVYHVNNEEEMVNLIKAENALAWTAHPRLKGSMWHPDAAKDKEWFHEDFWMAGEWKNQPPDFSQNRLGTKFLNALDDQSNWGERKYLLPDGDLFFARPENEMYSQMNVMYLQMDKLPAFDDDWSPILNAIKTGKSFISTGEIVLNRFSVNGSGPGEEANAAPASDIEAVIEGTFPLRNAYLFSGDSSEVYVESIDLSNSKEFTPYEFSMTADLSKRSWVRLEVWDVATNGAFTQPVWLAKTLTAR